MKGWRALAAAALALCGPVPARAFRVCRVAARAPLRRPRARAAVDPHVQQVVQSALTRAVGGGVSGALASVLQVISLMWMRTCMNYQYRYGTSFRDAATKLYADGGLARLYQGVSFAMVQVPLSRFGDTAMNSFSLLLLDSFEATRPLPLPVKTAFGSGAAGVWRFVIFPIDTLKTTLQVKGPQAVAQVRARVQKEGLPSLYSGAVAAAVSTAVGGWPYWSTYNLLQANLPPATDGDLAASLLRSAAIGFCASAVSDCCSNSLRVIKTGVQTADTAVTYVEVLNQVLQEDGVKGLLGRGLTTRLTVNGIQSALFIVGWKLIEQQLLG